MNDKTPELNEEGFLMTFELWNEKVACFLAKEEEESKTSPRTTGP